MLEQGIAGAPRVPFQARDCWGHIAATNDRIAVEITGHHRVGNDPAHQQARPSAAGRRAAPRIPTQKRTVAQALIGLAVPGRPIGPWSRRTGAPKASATRRDRTLGPCWVRGAPGLEGHERSPTVTNGSDEPQATGLRLSKLGCCLPADSDCGPDDHAESVPAGRPPPGQRQPGA